jgi:hypothetical protein
MAAGCATGDMPLLAVPGSASAAAGADGGVATGSTSTTGAPSGAATVDGPVYLPVRVRRLTDDEWRAASTALFGIASMTAASFTPDSTQTGFDVNDGQQVDPVFAAQIDAAAHEIASAAAALPSTAPTRPTAGRRARNRSWRRSFLRPTDAPRRKASSMGSWSSTTPRRTAVRTPTASRPSLRPSSNRRASST